MTTTTTAAPAPAPASARTITTGAIGFHSNLHTKSHHLPHPLAHSYIPQASQVLFVINRTTEYD